MMVGRSSGQLFTPTGGHRTTGQMVLEVAGHLPRPRPHHIRHATLLKDVSIDVRTRRDPRPRRADGRGAHRARPRHLRRRPLRCAARSRSTASRSSIRSPDGRHPRTASAWCPKTASSRRCSWRSRCAPTSSIASLEHLTCVVGFVGERAEAALVERYRKALDIRMASARISQSAISPAATSRKWCWRAGWRLEPKVLIVDEPTRGIDVAAKAEVHQLLDQMARAGIAIIAISSELPEVLAISDRIVTMREGPRHRRACRAPRRPKRS